MTEKPASIPPLDDAARGVLARLEALSLGPPSEGLSFEQRVARENGWSIEYTEQVCSEYRRFVFLCVHSGRPLTPSDAVDQVWHLHMCYTRSYWQRMCEEILGRPFHHEPTRGGSREANKFVDWYERTKEIYAEVFGETPPAEVWPSSEVRFANGGAWKRVNTAENWVISRAAVRRGTRAAAVLFALSLLVAGCSGEPSGVEIVILFVFVVFMVRVLTGAGRPKNRRGRGGRGGGGAGGGGFWGTGCGGDGSGRDRDDGDAGGCSSCSGGCGGGCGGD